MGNTWYLISCHCRLVGVVNSRAVSVSGKLERITKLPAGSVTPYHTALANDRRAFTIPVTRRPRPTRLLRPCLLPSSFSSPRSAVNRRAWSGPFLCAAFVMTPKSLLCRRDLGKCHTRSRELNVVETRLETWEGTPTRRCNRVCCIGVAFNFDVGHSYL